MNGNRKSKLHWHTESLGRRLSTAATIAELPFICELVTVRASDQTSTERLRRLCLLALAGRLSQAGCNALALESRGHSLDASDFSFWKRIQTSNQFHHAVTLSHVPGPAEPLLWIPDIVCGAFNTWMRGDARAWDLLKHRVTHTALDSKGQPFSS